MSSYQTIADLQAQYIQDLELSLIAQQKATVHYYDIARQYEAALSLVSVDIQAHALEIQRQHDEIMGHRGCVAPFLRAKAKARQ